MAGIRQRPFCVDICRFHSHPYDANNENPLLVRIRSFGMCVVDDLLKIREAFDDPSLRDLGMYLKTQVTRQHGGLEEL